jgi:hypothetical protein
VSNTKLSMTKEASKEMEGNKGKRKTAKARGD